ncbi:MAG TPA: hypothetical protein VFC78_04800 [Tepidisphaeraceae bacterium]|nr:hypothetical protein [Tepidisphaeraceae bacterium]
MFSGCKSMAAMAILAAGLAGCGDKGYQNSRPPSDRIDPANSDLQGYDVISASDKMAADLLSSYELNNSHNRWTIVVGKMEDDTSDRGFGHNYDIFLERLKTNLAQQSHGRVTLIENKARFHDLRNQELEGANERDTFGQGGGSAPAAAPQAIQPDYELYGKVTDLPGRGSTYYLMEFNALNLQNRTLPWSNKYEVTLKR